MPANVSPRRGNRKADLRRIIASYTRAFLRDSRVRMPRNNGEFAEKIGKGPEPFLEWAYGSAFGKGGAWHDDPSPRVFFEHLLAQHAANRPLSRSSISASTLATIEEVFRKSGPAKHARWTMAKDIGRRFGIVAEDFTRVAEMMRGRRFERD